MTTIVAWAGVDQRKVSSIYIASDSRISWGDSHFWDQGRKTFAAHCAPYIFGYWGDVLFPSLALPTILDQIATGLVTSDRSAFRGIANSIRHLWADYPSQERRDFGIVMASRRGESMRAAFEMAIMTYEANTNTWNLREVEMPQSSARLHIAGTGTRAVRSSESLWEKSTQAGTSRAVYGAFAEALLDHTDPHSGGGPQLVGLRRVGPGIRFGAVYQASRYLAGARVSKAAAQAAKLDWFNERFERVDGASRGRLPGAQRHQPR